MCLGVILAEYEELSQVFYVKVCLKEFFKGREAMPCLL